MLLGPTVVAIVLVKFFSFAQLSSPAGTASDVAMKMTLNKFTHDSEPMRSRPPQARTVSRTKFEKPLGAPELKKLRVEFSLSQLQNRGH